MKIKQSFVTNSSSTSFVIWGICIDKSEFKKNNELIEKVYNSLGDREPFDEYVEEYVNGYIGEYLYHLSQYLHDNNMIITCRPGSEYDDHCYIGAHPSDMSGDMTLNEFKGKIVTEINNLLNTYYTPDQIKIQLECYMN